MSQLDLWTLLAWMALPPCADRVYPSGAAPFGSPRLRGFESPTFTAMRAAGAKEKLRPSRLASAAPGSACLPGPGEGGPLRSEETARKPLGLPSFFFPPF